MLAETGFALLMVLASSSWHARAPLPVARAGYAAGVLHERLIVAGGSYWEGANKQRTSRVDAYEPSCNCWKVLAPMPAARSDAASVVADGQLFVLGGTDAQGAVRDVFSWDGKRWSRRDEMRLPEPRANGMAVVAGGRILLAGGLERARDNSSGLTTVWMWNLDKPDAGWKALPKCPCPPRASAGAALLDGKLILAGGLRADRRAIENLDDVWAFDLRNWEWSRITQLPQGRRALWASAYGGGLLLFGGFTDRFSADILFLRGSNVQRVGALPGPIADAKILALGGYWYAAGGEIGMHERGRENWSAKMTKAREVKQ